MKNIVLTRIDDRLIHGQVMTSWLNFTGANKIMVVDDVASKNLFLRTVLKNATPAHVKVGVFSVQKAVERLLGKGFKTEDRVILLAKNPETIYSLLEAGCSLDPINIGGMGAAKGREKFYKNISISPEEKNLLRKMIARGIHVQIQMIAEDTPEDVVSLLQ